MNKYEVSSTKEINKNNNVILIYIKEFKSNMEQIIKKYPDAKVGIYVQKNKIHTPDKLDLILNEIKQINSRLDKVDQRLNKVDQRLDKVDQRLDKVDQRLDKVDQRLDKIDHRIDNLVEKNSLNE